MKQSDNRLAIPARMSMLLALLCSFTLGGFAQTSSAAEPDENIVADSLVLHLSEADAIRIAMSENVSLKVAGMDITKQDYSYRSTLGALMPKIDMAAVYSATLKKQVMYIDFPGAPPSAGTGGIEVGRTHNTQASLSAAMPLIAPQLWQTIAMSREQMELTLEKARSSKIDMLAELRKAYLKALLADESYQVFKKSYDNAELNYKSISDKYELGLVAEFDKLRSEVQLRNLEPNLLQAESGRELSLMQLKLLMGIDVNQPIVLTDKLEGYKDELQAGSMNRSLSLDGNSTLKQLDIQQGLAKSAHKLEKLAFLPTLSLAFNYSYMLSSNEFKFSGENQHWTPYSTIALSLNIPIFNGGKRFYGAKSAAVGMLQLKLQRRNVEQSLQLAMISQRKLLDTHMRKFNSATEAVRSAEKGYSIAAVMYESGAGTLIQLNDADVALIQARLNYNQAIFDYVSAKADLDKMQGVEPRQE